MKMREKPFEEIYDLLAMRVLVHSVPECYHALGIIHHKWTPLQERIKDYIASPKSNGYQSLHTTVFGPDGRLYEIQIRTRDMHRTAEYGIAAHWLFKEGRAPDELDRHLAWFRQLIELQQDTHGPEEFLEVLKVDLYQDEIYVFTPRGDVQRLPKGATPIDFAFAVHTEVGLRCQGARINGRIAPLHRALKNGDSVEIATPPTWVWMCTWENLDGDLDEFTLKQLPRVFYNVVPSFLGQAPLYYTLDSSWVDYWRPEWARGQRLDLGPRVFYPLRLMPYVEVQPSMGVRATSYAVDWNGDPAANDHNSLQGRVLPDARLKLSSVLNRVYGLDFPQVKGVQHTIRPEVTYEYIPTIDQDSLPFFDPLDRMPNLPDRFVRLATRFLPRMQIRAHSCQRMKAT